MKNTKTIFSLLVAGLILGGCAANSTGSTLNSGLSTAKGPQFEKFETAQEGKSNIYIYRKAHLLRNVLIPDIHSENLKTKSDKVLPKLLPDGYIKETVDAGDYKIWAATEVQNEIIINAESKKTYCIQYYITPGFIVDHPQFKLQDISKCEQEIKKTKLSGQNI